MANHLSKTNVMNLLHNGIINVEFTKIDGSIRSMKCTLMEEFITKYINKTDTKKQVKEDIFVVWDLDKNDWRSFKYDSIINIYK